MALNIKNPDAVRLARELADETGESLTQVVITALDERLSAVRRRREAATIREAVAELQRFVASLPTRDARSGDEIIGYDEFGLPG